MAILINNTNDSEVSITEDKRGNTIITIGGQTTAEQIVESWKQLSLPNSELSKFVTKTLDVKHRR